MNAAPVIQATGPGRVEVARRPVSLDYARRLERYHAQRARELHAAIRAAVAIDTRRRGRTRRS